MSLSLNCIILGDKHDRVFTVEVPKNKNVSILKKLIKEEKASRLKGVDASDLDLWKVSLPVDTVTQKLTVDDIETCRKLRSVEKISSTFGEALEDEHVHILVEAPTGTLHKRLLELT